MPKITKVGRVMVPVSDDDQAIGFYTTMLGFSVAADVPFGENERRVQVAPPGGGPPSPWCRPRASTSPGG